MISGQKHVWKPKVSEPSKEKNMFSVPDIFAFVQIFCFVPWSYLMIIYVHILGLCYCQHLQRNVQ